MQVFKFGGASTSSIERIQQIPAILQRYPNDTLLLVVSAMGKTTSALEKLTRAYYQGENEKALTIFRQIKQQHFDIAKYLLVTHYLPCEKQMETFFTEVEWLLHDKPVRNFDYYYDQIVCLGELLASSILSAYLNEVGLTHPWVDARDLLRTDKHFREGQIDWQLSAKNVQQSLLPLFQKHRMVLTQGFIASTDENENCTLGLEGSDYSAAIFARLLQAKSVTLWKDVDGIMNADPALHPEAQLISRLSYEEAIEMACFGARIIHPKALQPLQEAQIPLLVKSFLHPEREGSIIQQEVKNETTPILVTKASQVLVTCKTSHLELAAEHALTALLQMLEALSLRPNLLQLDAVSIQVCLTDDPEKMEAFALQAAAQFLVQLEKGMELLTLRHPLPGQLEELTKNKTVRLLQQSGQTVHALLQV